MELNAGAVDELSFKAPGNVYKYSEEKVNEDSMYWRAHEKAVRVTNALGWRELIDADL